MRKKDNWALGLSIIAILLCIVTFLFFHTRLETFFPSTNDFLVTVLAVLVGVMAIFITILIGWQIYNSVEINRKIKDFSTQLETQSVELKKREEREKLLTEFFSKMIFGSPSLFDIDNLLLVCDRKLNDENKDIFNLILSSIYVDNIENVEDESTRKELIKNIDNLALETRDLEGMKGLRGKLDFEEVY